MAKNLYPIESKTSKADHNAQKLDTGLADVTQALQTTLSLERMIELFSLKLNELVPHSGVRYRNTDLNLEVRHGRQGRHSCTYRLTLGDEPLGKLTLRRSEKFTESELETVERLVCGLLYPLRNALLYQDAISMARRDPLTGTSNRAALDDVLRREISHAGRHGSQCALLMVDIDHFKQVNDRYGHIVGDCALKAVAGITDGTMRDGDQLFRYGGEEFVVLLRETGLRGARRLAERIRSNIAKTPCHCSGAELSLTVSIGISAFAAGDTPLSLFVRADEALFEAKAAGRNQVCARSASQTAETA
jgi:diguanylate cyclase (GGDEF)-like protein